MLPPGGICTDFPALGLDYASPRSPKGREAQPGEGLSNQIARPPVFELCRRKAYGGHVRVDLNPSVSDSDRLRPITDFRPFEGAHAIETYIQSLAKFVPFKLSSV